MPLLEKFATLSETSLYKLIIEMAPKSYKVVIIPEKLLKGVQCIPTLSKIINLSLNTGKVHEV